MSDVQNPPAPCADCGGTEGRGVWLPGDGTSAMESVWVPCQSCCPDYYERQRR